LTIAGLLHSLFGGPPKLGETASFPFNEFIEWQYHFPNAFFNRSMASDCCEVIPWPWFYGSHLTKAEHVVRLGNAEVYHADLEAQRCRHLP
jgi:hypothetical protein